MSLLVRFSLIHYCTYTLRLSTWWSFREIIGKSNLGVGFALNMLSALIRAALSYPTMPLVRQLVHQRCVHSGPLVLRVTPLKFPDVHSGYKPNCLTHVDSWEKPTVFLIARAKWNTFCPAALFPKDKERAYPILLLAWTISYSLDQVLLSKDLTYEISF